MTFKTGGKMPKSRRLQASAEERENVVAFIAEGIYDLTKDCGTILVLNDRLHRLKIEGSERWCRYIYKGNTSSIELTSDKFDGVVYRIDPNRKGGDMYIQLAASRLKPGGTLWIVGANDEGIKSTAKHLSPWFKDSDTIDFKRRCRIIQATRTEAPAKGTIKDWSSTIKVDDVRQAWMTFPGLFAGGGADSGTDLLLEALSKEKVKKEAYICDFGCGSGVLTSKMTEQFPEAQITGVDADTLAIMAYQNNVSNAKSFVSDGWHSIPNDSRFDLICSNPPMHIGKSEDFGIIHSLIKEAPSRLRYRGALYLVVLRQIPIQQWLEESFSQVEMIAETNHYWVWRAQKSRR